MMPSLPCPELYVCALAPGDQVVGGLPVAHVIHTIRAIPVIHVIRVIHVIQVTKSSADWDGYKEASGVGGDLEQVTTIKRREDMGRGRRER